MKMRIFIRKENFSNMYRVYSHSMINAALKHYKINKIALSLHVDTTQNTMVKKPGS